MPAIYSCECQDKRILTGTSKWTPAELKQMTPLQLAQVLSELKEFASYYTSNFYIPLQKLEQETQQLKSRYENAKKFCLICGITTALFTFFWAVLALIPAMRFSGLTLLMAILTFISIIVFIPMLFWFMSAQDDFNKRYPRANAKMERLLQKQAKDVYGTYADYLVSGFLVSPEFSLSESTLDYMIQMLNSRRANNLPEATMLAKKKFGRSPIPRIITGLHNIGDSTERTASSPVYDTKKSNITQMENQGPDLQAVLQLSEYLHSALRSYAVSQKATDEGASVSPDSLTLEEDALINEFRALSQEERNRIRRVVHSFYTNHS